jgi:hypothetical protein
MFKISSFRLVALFLCVCVSTTAIANSFGLAMGVPSDELDTVKHEEAPVGMLQLLNVSEPNINYKTYLGQFSGQQGLCWTKGIGVDVESDSYGTEIRARFDAEKLRLTEIYGEPEEIDFRFTGNVESDLGNWLRAIRDGDRYVAAIWKQKSTVKLPGGLQNVGLVINAATSSIGYL